MFAGRAYKTIAAGAMLATVLAACGGAAAPASTVPAASSPASGAAAASTSAPSLAPASSAAPASAAAPASSASVASSTAVSPAPSAPGANVTTGSAAPSIATKAGGTVTIRLSSDPDNFDIQKTQNGMSLWIAFATYDRLLDLDDQGNVIPYLATSWKQTPSQVVLTMRTDATCADGSKITPSVAAKALTRLEDPATASMLTVARKYGSKLTAVADDANNTLTLNLDPPFQNIMQTLATPGASIPCPAYYNNLSNMGTQMFGSGPYQLVSATRGSSYTVKARPDYKWGPKGMTTQDPGVPDTIVFPVVPNETTAANELLAGQVSIVSINGPDAQRLDQNKSLYSFVANSFGTYLLMYNQAEGRPSTDPAFRKALAMAIDQNAYNKVAYNGQGLMAGSVFAPGTTCYSDASAQYMPKYDVAGAKAALAQLGYKPGADGKLAKDGKPLTLKVIGFDQVKDGAQYVGQVFDQLGIATTTSVTDGGTYQDAFFKKSDYDIAILPRLGEPTPDSVAQYLTGPDFAHGGLNVSFIKDPAFDSAYAAAKAAPSLDAACKAWADAQVAIIKNMDVLPVGAPPFHWYGAGVKFSIRRQGMIVNALTVRKTS